MKNRIAGQCSVVRGREYDRAQMDELCIRGVAFSLLRKRRMDGYKFK